MLIFIKMHSILCKPKDMLFSSIIFDSLTELLGKIDHYVENQVVQRDQMAQEESNKSSKPKMDDFFGGGDDDESSDGGLIDFDAPAAPAAPKTSKVKVEEIK
jgi:hypothetical protein